MAPIKIPTTPRSAYDPKRPANALLLTQVRELERFLSRAGRRIRRKKPKTEEQVASYIRHLNRALHHQVVLPEMTRRTLDVPLPGQRKASRPKPRIASAKRATASLDRKRKASSSRRRMQGRRS